MKEEMSIKWSIIWIVIHAITFFITSYLVKFIPSSIDFVYFILLGLGVTIFANIIRIFTRKSKFVVDKWFLFWFAINSITIYIFNLINDLIKNTNIYILCLIVAFGLVLVAYIIRKININGKYVIYFALGLFILLFLVVTFLIPLLKKEIDLPDFSNLLNSCPQINVPLVSNYPYAGLKMGSNNYDGWVIYGKLDCKSGSLDGENKNNYYCGGYESVFGIGKVRTYIQKTDVSKDGDIGKTTKYVIWNSYDKNLNFIKTECLGNPDEFEEKQVQSFLDQIKDLTN